MWKWCKHEKYWIFETRVKRSKGGKNDKSWNYIDPVRI